MHEHLNTGTAADMLSYEKYLQTGTTYERLTRVATASEEWVVSDWDGEVYSVRFDKNFSKKHLATFSKDTHRAEEAAYYAWLNSGKTTDAGKNWQTAEHQLLNEKMNTTAANRSVAKTCSCGHPLIKHPSGGPCNVPGCVCAAFGTPFTQARQAQGKPTKDPLGTTPAPKSTFIVMNWVPKGDFEQVVVKSIQALEKPDGWKRGDPLHVAVGAEVWLKWDFGSSRVGAVVVASKLANTNPTPADLVQPASWDRKQGCYVKAKKIATDVGRQTWQVLHMGTPNDEGGSKVPF